MSEQQDGGRITLRMVVEAARKVGDRFPTRVNPQMEPATPDQPSGCLYTYEDGTHCLAGQILLELGFKIPAYNEPNNDGTGVGTLLEREGIDERFEPDALLYLGKAQRLADGGMRWVAATGECEFHR